MDSADFMDSAELRDMQQPLKDAYREHPEQAVVTLRAEGQTLIRLTERYCVVYQTLAHPADLALSVR